MSEQETKSTLTQKQIDALENCVRDLEVFDKKMKQQIFGTMDDLFSNLPEQERVALELSIKMPMRKALSRLKHVSNRLNKNFTLNKKNGGLTHAN